MSDTGNSKPLFFRVNKNKKRDMDIKKDIYDYAEELGGQGMRSEAMKQFIDGGRALWKRGKLNQTIGQMKDEK